MMNITFAPMLAMLGLGREELLWLVLALLVFVVTIGVIVMAVIFLVKKLSPHSDQSRPPQPTAPNPISSPSNNCPQCGTPLLAGALAGLCPACLLKTGNETDTAPHAPQTKFNPPSTEDLAAKFPQLQILELIGRGGMGAVYKARQKQLDRIVALKILPPSAGADTAFAERFTREARALARLNHPNIVTLYEFGESAGQYYFLMEFVDGMNLRQLLDTSRISPREALAIVPQICDALQFAHDQGIVHRDIKPENILLDRRGQVKVADFGLAKIMADATEKIADPTKPPVSTALTDAGKVMGTPQYMSPEQKENPAGVDHRADIYALGVVFYQMLTGELPDQHLAPPSRKVQIDVRLDEVVLRALENKPELRFQQASILKTQVETIVGTPPLSAGSPPNTTTSTAWTGDAMATAAPIPSEISHALSAWLRCVDYAQYEQSWDLATPVFKKAISRSQWAEKLGKIRRPLGQVLSRNLKSARFKAGKNLFTARFHTSFNGQSATETITLAPQSNGDWQVICYFLVPSHHEILGWKIAFWSMLGATLLAVGIPACVNLVIAAYRHSSNANASHPTEIQPGVYVGQTYFPYGDSIEITNVEWSGSQITVRGTYNLVSEESASLALNVTAPSAAEDTHQPEVPSQTMRISRGMGNFELVRPNLPPGLPHVSMYDRVHSFAGVYFGSKEQATRESRLNLSDYSQATTQTNFYVGQTYFPHGDSIAITNVEQSGTQLIVQGSYNLVSEDAASLTLNFTATNANDVFPGWPVEPAHPPQTMHILRGKGNFKLFRPRLLPGLPHVSMYGNGHSFAGVYFGSKEQAVIESKLDLTDHPHFGLSPIIERFIPESKWPTAIPLYGQDSNVLMLINYDSGRLHIGAAEDWKTYNRYFSNTTSNRFLESHSIPPFLTLDIFNMDLHPVFGENNWEEISADQIMQEFSGDFNDTSSLNSGMDSYVLDMSGDEPSSEVQPVGNKGALSPPPAAWLFLTHNHQNLGILKIIGFTENPLGVKICYKWVQPLTNTAPAN